MTKKSLQRNIVRGEELETKIQKGVESIYDVAVASYGVNAGNALITMRFGEPLISHDGITNIGKLVVADETTNAAISVIRQAAEKTNRIAGDATSLTTILSCLIYNHYKNRDYSSTRLMMDEMTKHADAIQVALRECSEPATKQDLISVAKTSTGDDAIAQLVADSVAQAGDYGSVVINETAEPQVFTDIIAGATFNKGIKTPALVNDPNTLKTNYNECLVLVLDGVYTKNQDILPILEETVMSNQEKKLPIVLIGDVSGQALETVISNHRNGVIDIAIVEPIFENRDTFLDDIATYCGAKVFVPGGAKFDSSFIGHAESAAITLTTTTIESTSGKDKSKERANKIKEQLEEINGNTERVQLERRLAILDGRSVKIYVGANTQAERQETKLRIEDAVCAVRAAKDNGTLPGGGVALRNIGAALHLNFLRQPYCLLNGISQDDEVIPAEMSALYNSILDTDDTGYDILTREKVNMRKAGILDSTIAISEAIANAYSAAQSLLTVKVALEFTEEEK